MFDTAEREKNMLKLGSGRFDNKIYLKKSQFSGYTVVKTLLGVHLNPTAPQRELNTDSNDASHSLN